jgi:hypothetical protein
MLQDEARRFDQWEDCFAVVAGSIALVNYIATTARNDGMGEDLNEVRMRIVGSK